MVEMKGVMTNREIQDLLRRAQDGDQGAFEVLVNESRDEIARYVRLRVGAHLRERVDVEDVLQETFAGALQSVARFDWRGDRSFVRWLQGISEHVILKLANKNRRDPLFYVEADAPSEDVSPSRSMRRGERFDRLEEALNSLSPDHREVIILARLKGLRMAEVAERMNRSPNAAVQLLSRALASLRAAFGDTESLHLPPWNLNEGGGRDEQ